MDLFQAVILGVVQGLTEFLPISSTAHLRIVPAMLGWDDPGAAFTAVIQFGTLLAVLSYFFADIAATARATLGLAPSNDPGALREARLGRMIAVGTVPLVVCGLLFEEAIETKLRSLSVIAGR